MVEGGLYGSVAQRRLQAGALESLEATRRTPGAVFAARMSGTEDPERFGWDRISAILRAEGAMTFRMIAAGACPEVERRLAALGFAVAWWDVFEGSRDEVAVACDGVLAAPRNDVAPLVPFPGDEAEFLARVQAFMAKGGVAPFPAQVLSGETGAAALAVLGDARDGSMVATAFAHFPYNRHSPHRATAWAGLATVREDFRGRGIGVWVNALALRRAVIDLRAERAQEFARKSNAASRRMIERCGLRLRPDLLSGIAQPLGSASFTR